jgi:ribonuclease D
MADPATRGDLLSTKGFHGRGAQRYADRWVAALARARELPEDDLPVRAPRTDGPPTPRAWAERDPVAAQRLTLARDGMAQLSEQLEVPAENLLTPDTVRRVMWEPAGADLPALSDQLRALGAREWQIELTAPMLLESVAGAQSED